jgi:hypothetical protein
MTQDGAAVEEARKVDEASVLAEWIVADVRMALERGYVAGAPAAWLDRVQGQLARIDELRADLYERIEATIEAEARGQ